MSTFVLKRPICGGSGPRGAIDVARSLCCGGRFVGWVVWWALHVELGPGIRRTAVVVRRGSIFGLKEGQNEHDPGGR